MNGICEAAKSIKIKMIKLSIKYDKLTYNYQKWLEKFFKVLIALNIATDISV